MSHRYLLVVAVVGLGLGAWFLSCVTAGAQETRDESRLFRALGAVTILTAAIDTAQTAGALARPGYREANPALRPLAAHPLALGAGKGAAAIGLNAWTARVWKRHPRAALIARAVVVGAWSAAIAVNLKTVRR
jgi:hypothetical protein